MDVSIMRSPRTMWLTTAALNVVPYQEVQIVLYNHRQHTAFLSPLFPPSFFFLPFLSLFPSLLQILIPRKILHIPQDPT
jgi:hypothetical protein